MKTSTKLLLSGAVIICLSLIVFGTDAVHRLITFYQNLDSPSAREWAEGISDSVGSALFGVSMVFLRAWMFLIGFISIFFAKRRAIDRLTSIRRRITE